MEAAHNHARFAPHSKLTQFYRRIQAKRGTSKAAAATASKMARIMYPMLKNGRELSMGTTSFFIPVRSSSNVFYMGAQAPRVANC